MTTETLAINVGPLSGFESLCTYSAEPLNRFNDQFQRGARPDVEWDLRHVESGRINMAGLTAFLSFAHRLRQFTGQAPYAHFPHDDRVLDFLKDISFLQIGKKYDLWHSDLGGLRSLVRPGRTNPNTTIFVFELSSFPAPGSSEFNTWKDYVRQEIKKELLLKCGPVFRPRADAPQLPESLPDEIAITCAELVLNSVIHGRSPAFVGLQRTYPRISVAVCDVGKGFLQTLQAKQLRLGADLPFVETDLQAMLLGSLVNKRGYGLRRAIDTIISAGGWVEMSSGESQITWRAPLWDKTVAAAASDYRIILDPARLHAEQINGWPSATQQSLGYFRKWDHGLRGARVAFEIPMRSDR